MKNTLIIAAMSASIIALAGCESVETKPLPAVAKVVKSQTQLSYDAAIASAKAANGKAKAAGNEWRDTGKLIKAAKAAAAQGKYYKGKKLAQKAKVQAQIAAEQAKGQLNVGNPAYLY